MDTEIKATQYGWPNDEELRRSIVRLGLVFVSRAHEAALIEDAQRRAR